MTAAISSDDYLQLLDCVRELHRCRSLEAFPERVLRTLAPLVPSTLAAFNEVNVARERILAVTDRPVADSGTCLTRQAREVLEWMAEGKSNAEIAAILGVASGTVKRHGEQILGKLHVANRTGAAAVARQRGWLAPRSG